MRFFLSLCSLSFILPLLRAQEAAPTVLPSSPIANMEGEVSDGRYISPTGLFSVEIPVLPVLGARISDTANVVTFQDEFSTHVTIAVFPMDATMKWELKTQGRKEFLIQFFAKEILPGIRESLPGSSVQSGKYLAPVHDGSLLLMTLMPSGSRFLQRILLLGGGNDPIPVAKRGNLLLIHGDNVVIISSELAERTVERSQYTLNTEQEDALLNKRLQKILATIHFRN